MRKGNEVKQNGKEEKEKVKKNFFKNFENENLMFFVFWAEKKFFQKFLIYFFGSERKILCII